MTRFKQGIQFGLWAAIGWGCFSALAQAQSLTAKSIKEALTPVFSDKNKLAGSQINWDNDAWVFGHTDRWYTNDLRQKERQRPNNAAAKTRTAASYPVQFTGRLHGPAA